jgi:predicted cupin superfamily sugar epimerase
MQSLPLNAVSVAANTTLANVLSGQPIQYMGKAGVLTIYANGSAAGLQWSLAINDGQSNQQVVPNGSTLSPASTAGKIKTNEDFVGQFAIPAGVQLQLSVTNTTGGALTANFLFVIT